MFAYQTVESFNNDLEVAGMNFETSAHLLDRVVKERKSHRAAVLQDGLVAGLIVVRMLKRMKEQPPLHGDVEG
jgi:hypothetical protein